MSFLWILIPLAGIASIAWSEWLKFKRQALQLGSSTAELESTVTSLKEEIEELREERMTLVHRIQNLEAIVTSEAWDTLGSDRELAAAKAPPLELPEAEETDEAEQVARIAKRLRR